MVGGNSRGFRVKSKNETIVVGSAGIEPALSTSCIRLPSRLELRGS